MLNTQLERRHTGIFRTALNGNQMLCPLAAIEELCEDFCSPCHKHNI